MRSHEIASFLNPYEQIVKLRDLVRGFVHTETPPSSLSKFVDYSSLENEPSNFKAQVLHVRVIGRFEISKYESGGREFAAGQYAFFQKDGEKEVRLTTAIRLVPPEHVVLPDGKQIEFYSDVGDDDPHTLHQLRRVRDGISEALLAEVLGKIEKWSFS